MKVISLILTTLISAITAKNCQTQGQCCTDPNEEYLVSGFEYTCKDYDSIVTKPAAVGCFCKSGYVRNEGKCIPKGQCPQKCKGPNEIHPETPCACGPDYTCCGLIYNNTQGHPKCHCKPGHVRGDDGKCIPKGECLSMCDGPNEIHNVTGRDYTCDNLPHYPSKDGCCYCKPGYVRDKNDKCIAKDKCPPKCKDPNEIHPETSCACGPDYTCCGLIYNNTQGYPKCHCKPGHVRGDDGKCIPKGECLSMCDGPNEIHNVTGRDYTCDNLPHYPSKDGCCYCEPGYVRDKNDKCIAKDKCPPKCKGPNEIHPETPCACGPDYTCCGLIYNNTQGYPKCHCKPGHVRGDDGKCIPKSECPLMCDGPNEIHNVTGRDYTCDNLPHYPSKDGCCYCEPGYVRDKNDKCIAKDKCPPKCKGPNEIHPETPCACGPDYTCCGLIYNNTQGYPKCHCKPGHVRGDDGKCIPKGECLSMCDGPNEIHNVTGRDYTCDNLPHYPSKDGCCYCKPGYVRDKNDKCIAKDKCPPKCKDPNEIHPETSCACGPDYTCCGLIYNNTQGYPKCHCKPGHVRGDDGKCIPKGECLSMCDGPNEIHNVTGRDYTCDNLPHYPSKDGCCYCKPGYVRDKNDKCIAKDKCPPKCKDPNEIHPETSCACGPDYTCCGLIYNNTQGYPKCHCKPGHVRGDDGKCIPKGECLSMCDGPNEIHNVTGRDYTCDNLPHYPSKDGCCYCEPGYVRDKNDKCIAKDKCPPKCKGPNEIHPETPCACGPDYTCCGLIYNNTQGYPKCHCKPGHVRGDDGKCIPKGECLSMCDGPNEIHNVTGRDYTCDNLPHYPSKDGCCYCKPGYVRDKNDKCIAKDKCPPKCKDPNEIHPETSCACGPDYTCCGLIYNNTQGYPKCHCKPGHVRGNDGKCIPKGECLSMCDGPNEIHNVTGRDYTCDNLPHYPSKDDCCYCEPGYVRDKNDKCIAKDKCPPKCKGPNEIHPETPCACGPDYTCCGLIYNNTQGYPKCHCKPGHVRGDDGKCIPKDECPPKCNGPNTIYKDTGCNDTCDGPPCKPINRKGCYCIPGHVTNTNGKCIPKGECPPKCSGPNTIYKDKGCNDTCDGPPCKPINRKGCYCIPGYVTNTNGKCISKSECPPKCNGPNEVHKTTGFDYTCGVICITSHPKTGKGCYCKAGYVRNAAGKCILKANCRP